MNEEISATSLICITEAGDRLPVTISIGRPFKDDDGLWACPVSLQGLYTRLSPMKSGDSFHALCLSIMLVRDLLVGFVERGGRILIAEGEGEQELPLDAYFPSPSHDIGEHLTTPGNFDDGQRPEWGVGVFVREYGEGSRLTLDTLKRTDQSALNWETWAFITHGPIERAKLLDLGFSQEEYVALGQVVMGVLAALVKKNDSE